MSESQATEGIDLRSERPTILVIDDTKENLMVIGEALQGSYRIRLAKDGPSGLEAAHGSPRPDLILLDVMMPGIDGYQVMAELRKSAVTRDIPVIFVTTLSADEDEEYGLSLGAVDYITKPIRAAILMARVRTHLAMKRIRDQLKNHNALLEIKVQERTEALEIALERAESAHSSLRKTYFGTLKVISELAELRGGPVGAHSQRVANLVRQVAPHCGLKDAELQDVFVAALLHDVGMLGFPEEVYHKPVSSMTGDELGLYRRHPTTGATIIGKIATMDKVADLIKHHHEYYDGTGFPDCLSGLEIPFGSRLILAISDYDALKHGMLTSQPLSPKQSFQYLIDESGRRYDPSIIEILEPLVSRDESFEIDEVRVEARHLQDGMILAREIMHPDGFLLLSKGTKVKRRVIDQIVEVEKRTGVTLEIFVNRQ